MTTMLKAEVSVIPGDRPGWIPPDILYDWDICPYAYQTEEELMPAGGPHGRLLAYIMEILRDFIESKKLMLLIDTFMLYRDYQGVKQRVAPDLLLMPFRSDEPSAYDLDTEPPPLLVAELTSPKSHVKDMEENVSFYNALGISAYLAIDAITPDAEPRKQIGLYLWRSVGNQVRRVRPDMEGYLPLPEMGLRVKVLRRRFIFSDIATGEILKDSGELRQWAEEQQQQAEELQERLETEQQRAEAERQQAEELQERLETEQQRAETERQRAEEQQERAETERQRAEMAEKNARRLVEQLRAMGIEPSFSS